MEYLIADTHYFHKNVIQFEAATRGKFVTVEEMNSHLIHQWNSVVTDNDTVYHMGDFSLHGSYSRMVDILNQLNGKIIMIQGNHDDTKVFNRLLEDGYIEEFHQVGVQIKRNKQVLWLTHYPMEIGLRERKWSIHGHIHSDPSQYANQINVGVDSQFMNEIMNIPFGQPIELNRLIQYLEEHPILRDN